MMELAPTTILQRLPDLRLRLEPGGTLRVQSERGALRCAGYALAILDAFYRPTPLAAAVERVRGLLGVEPGAEALAATIGQLYRAGLLREAAPPPPSIQIDSSTYDSSPIHIAMLDDRSRVAAFLAGIRELVRPGDVVLDLGTGLGVFAIAAAQAGARHVYAVEAGAVGWLARANIAANGLADRITLMQGWSQQLTLPERADVLISEMVGNEPHGDFMLEVMRDARKRLLKPDARMVPAKVRIYGLPVTVPDSLIRAHRPALAPERLRDWPAPLGAVAAQLAATPLHHEPFVSVRPYEARGWPALSAPILIDEIDFMQVTQLMVDLRAPFTAGADGLINGLLIFFETELGPTARLSLSPAAAGQDTFRYTPLRLLGRPLEVRAGEPLEFRYRYRVPGAPGSLSIERR